MTENLKKLTVTCHRSNDNLVSTVPIEWFGLSNILKILDIMGCRETIQETQHGAAVSLLDYALGQFTYSSYEYAARRWVEESLMIMASDDAEISSESK